MRTLVMNVYAAGMVIALAFAPTVALASLDGGLAALRRGDYGAAMTQLLPVAEEGDPTAQFEVGVMYGNGDGVPQDIRQAIKWFRLAAGRGHAQAKASLDFFEAGGLTDPTPDGGERSHAVAPDEPPTGPQALLQIATVATEAAASREWRRQQKHFPDQLGGLNPVIEPFDGGERGPMFRVFAGPLDQSAARAACDALKGAGGTCLVIRRAQ